MCVWLCVHTCVYGVVVCVFFYLCVYTYLSNIISISKRFLYLSFVLLTTL